ncbi:hypothetical protein SPFM9_00244 [Salmonella phage SPFM9]|nr:hypothetical protein SPFM9_00244 [Salmonella phage SPFM9]
MKDDDDMGPDKDLRLFTVITEAARTEIGNALRNTLNDAIIGVELRKRTSQVINDYLSTHLTVSATVKYYLTAANRANSELLAQIYIDVRTEDGVVSPLPAENQFLKPLLLEQTEGFFVPITTMGAYLDSVIDNIINYVTVVLPNRSEMAVFDARYKFATSKAVKEQIFDGNGQPIIAKPRSIKFKGDPKIDPATGEQEIAHHVGPEYTYDPDAVPPLQITYLHREDVLAYWEKDVIKTKDDGVTSYYWRKARAVTDSINYEYYHARDGIGITHEIFKIELGKAITGYYPGNYERAEMDTMIVPPEVDVDTPAPLLTEYNVFYG